MGSGKAGKSEKRMAFISGFLIGGALSAFTFYLTAVPSGKRALQLVKEESISFGNKGVELFQTAKQKSVGLAQSQLAVKNVSPEEQKPMIPIPRDY
ncbi:YtxH domain-containing protein [Sporolactobacillus sp. CPB3-1]|uniref:YtxH domain-containing protein n=1 Tax=Sporolactobacillus mangiferae TaxID=2940498 RepID=A0ABT0M707_9BACL|nr:YtxH domain-containing protein [Sporolactobacillus mangiferae]MCL1630642.1 YtxH domain-containing protein [Sporolactobacillus mangiferae]